MVIGGSMCVHCGQFLQIKQNIVSAQLILMLKIMKIVVIVGGFIRKSKCKWNGDI